MASAIEIALYGKEQAQLVAPTGEVGEHCILEFVLAVNSIILRIAPEDREYVEWTKASFHRAALLHFGQTAAEPDDLYMPWTIVGFHSFQEQDGRWRFNLNTHAVRWSWISEWPVVERGRF